MKNINIIFFILISSIINKTNAQTKWWGGYTVNEVVDKADLIFEGHILTDTPYFQSPPGNICTRHTVLVLKQFKGSFNSDTIIVITYGGRMKFKDGWEGTPEAYAFKGDEAVFLVTNSTKIEYAGSDPRVFDPFYGPGVSYVTPCNKKDPVKEVYEPLEKVIGHPYIELRPNTCAEQQAKAAAKEKAEHPHRKFNINEK